MLNTSRVLPGVSHVSFKCFQVHVHVQICQTAEFNKAKSLLDAKFEGLYIFKFPYYVNVLSKSHIHFMSMSH